VFAAAIVTAPSFCVNVIAGAVVVWPVAFVVDVVVAAVGDDDGMHKLRELMDMRGLSFDTSSLLKRCSETLNPVLSWKASNAAFDLRRLDGWP